MDMRYYWLQDRVRQNQFDVYWRPGKYNLGDDHTKHHPAQHHQDMRPILLHQTNSLNIMRGCVKLPHPQPRKPTDTQTVQHTLRATQVRCALARADTVKLQNRPLRHLLEAHFFINNMFNTTYLSGVHYRCQMMRLDPSWGEPFHRNGQ
jgi:hypothetical protein